MCVTNKMTIAAMYGFTILESKKGNSMITIELGGRFMLVSLKEESKDSTTLTLEPTKGTIDTKFLSKAKYGSPFCIVRKLKGLFRQHYWR